MAFRQPGKAAHVPALRSARQPDIGSWTALRDGHHELANTAGPAPLSREPYRNDVNIHSPSLYICPVQERPSHILYPRTFRAVQNYPTGVRRHFAFRIRPIFSPASAYMCPTYTCIFLASQALQIHGTAPSLPATLLERKAFREAANHRPVVPKPRIRAFGAEISVRRGGSGRASLFRRNKPASSGTTSEWRGCG